MSENGDQLDHIRIPFENIKFGNKLEIQGYGAIYEGEFDDRKVALKRLNITNLANIKQKLLAEILTISEFRHHPNLVALLGFCDEKSNEIILVYEFVGSGNLADMMRKRLNTIQRLEICLGAARGLEYLHTGVDSTKHGIVHGNIKPSKILLNSSDSTKFEAKVSSFGLSKIVPGQASIKSTEDIEKVTKESDVYDFGVLLLEVLCGVSELVDTDDYQERHVTELVPKRLEQDKVRKIVHFDIRKEIKTEALETYVKIACQCVMENVEARPTMGQVVKELEKALRLQGGEVAYVKIIGGKNITGAPDERVVEDGPNDDTNSVSMDSNVDVNIPITEEEVNDSITNDKLDVTGEGNGDEINIVDATSDHTNDEKNTVEDITTEERRYYVPPVLDNLNGVSVPNLTKTEDAQKESSNKEPETTEEIIDDSNSIEKSKIIVENEDDNQNRTQTEDAPKESKSNDPETTEEIIDDSNSNKKSNIHVENEDDNPTITHIEDAQKESSNNEPETTEEIKNDSNSNVVVGKEDENQFKTHNEDIQKESSNNEPETAEEIIDHSNLKEKSNIAVEIEDDTHNRSQTEDAQEESSNNDPETTEETTDDSNSNEKSTIVVEDVDDNQTRTYIEDAQKEISSTNGPDTTEEIKDDLNSNEKSNLTGETEDDNQSTNIASITESSNIDTIASDHSTNQKMQNTGILESDSRDFNILPDEHYDKENVDELEHLRIPFEKIKFGKKIDVRGYGSMFKGEFKDQQVALKRLNITNLGNIKPKLLSEILTISKFKLHPNVVALIGFCDEKNNEIILVYEYVSSGNLADKMSKHLTTIQRLEICLGAARGLDYLHMDIIHGDIKLSKILLNSDSNSSKFEAKVSGFGLSKLLPGNVQIARKSTKESDVYSFGVLLLEVLCGVPNLVDTDDYQEKHVTELVPKRLEQNMLRKIVHFDIRDEIKAECLETYAKIACRCVMKERPTMAAEVVIELEKALRLQGGEVDDIQILGSSNGKGLPKETEYEDDQEVKDNSEKMESDIAADKEPELKIESIEETVDDIASIEQSSDIPILGSEDDENVPEITQIEDAKKESNESTEEITVDLKSNEESKITGEYKISQESKIITSQESEDATKESGNDGPDNKEIMDDKVTAMEITVEVKNQVIPEMIGNIREGGFSDFSTNDKLLSVEKTQESESKRSNSTCSESSNGDSTTPSDYLLPKNPANGTTVKKTSDGSRNCCSCSWWGYIFGRVVFYGGQFWNKLVACFTWIRGQCSSKND